METIEVSSRRGAVGTIVQLLGAARKPVGGVRELPEVNFVMPQVTLDGAHLAKYRSVCGFSAEQGVPLIYPQILAFPLMMQFMASRHCPWPAMGTVHLANLIEQHEALHVDDTLRVELSTGDLFVHDKGQVFTLDLRIFRAEQLIWQATQSLLRLGIKAPAGDAYATVLSGELPLSHQADFSAPGNIGRRYGRVSGDINPIHLSAVSARLLGFKRAIAHGMWTKARALAALLPAYPVGKASAAVEFKTPLLLPARPGLWTCRSDPGTVLFEVRDSKGQKPHLRGQLHFA
jgi:MaoC like domain